MRTFSDSRTLCNSDSTMRLRLSVYDEDNDGSHDLIGSVQSTLAQLLEVGQGGEGWKGGRLRN